MLTQTNRFKKMPSRRQFEIGDSQKHVVLYGHDSRKLTQCSPLHIWSTDNMGRTHVIRPPRKWILYTQTCTYIHKHARTHTQTFAYNIHTRRRARAHTHTHTHTHTRTHAHTHTHARACTHAHTHTRTHAHTHTRTHARAHAHTRTHTHLRIHHTYVYTYMYYLRYSCLPADILDR